MAKIHGQCPPYTFSGITLHGPDPMPTLRGGQVSPSPEALGNCSKDVQCLWWGKGRSGSTAHQAQWPHFCDPGGTHLPTTAGPRRDALGEALLPRLPRLPGSLGLSPPPCSQLSPLLILVFSLRPTPMLGSLPAVSAGGAQFGAGQGDRESLLLVEVKHMRSFLCIGGTHQFPRTTLTEPHGRQATGPDARDPNALLACCGDRGTSAQGPPPPSCKSVNSRFLLLLWQEF